MTEAELAEGHWDGIDSWEPCCGLDAATQTLMSGIRQIMNCGYYNPIVLCDLAEAVCQANATSKVQQFSMPPREY